MNTKISDLTDLTERSSLGTEGARLLRQRASKKNVESVVAAADERPQDDLEALVNNAVDGDPDAYMALLRRIRPLVVRYCRARIGGQDTNFATADDVAQEVCLAVFAALPSYRDQGRPFLAFVYGIAAHKVADARRSAARNRADRGSGISNTSPQAEQTEVTDQTELAHPMHKLLDMLPDKQREIIRLTVVLGLSIEETADAVGSTPGAVQVARHRALGRLRNILTAEGSI